MKIIGMSAREVEVVLAHKEVYLMKNALNEVCNGFRVRHFELKIGDTRERAGVLGCELFEIVRQMSAPGEAHG